MQSIFVTGGAGFVGSHVVERALDRGMHVTVLDDLSSGRIGNLPVGVDLHRVDIANADEVIAICKDMLPPSAVIHCAAQASVVRAIEDPARNHAVNVEGTTNILRICETFRCPLVFTSTAGVYGDYPHRPIPESAPVAPLSPYAQSKALGEALIHAHATEHDLPHVVCRLANVYGPRQRGDGEAGVVAIFAHRIRHNESITLFGNGLPTRDFIHVTDVAKGLFGAIGRRGTYNIATGTETSVREIFDLACEALSSQASPVMAELRSGEILNSSLDPALALNELGWNARVAVANGIPDTIKALAYELDN